VFPEKYTVGFPLKKTYSHRFVAEAKARGAMIPSLRARPQALRYIDDWIQANCSGRKVVTVTLREASWQQYRNSALGEWGRFIGSLDRDAYCPVVLRDIETESRSVRQGSESCSWTADIPLLPG
jgi:hypothetical protein